MIAPRARSANLRSLIGLGVVAGVLALVVAFAPRPADPGVASAPDTAGLTAVSTVRVDDGHTLRLWASPSRGYVEDVGHGGIDFSGGAPVENRATVVLGGILGDLTTRGAAAVDVRVPGGLVVRAPVGHGRYLLPDVSELVLFVTPLDGQGRPLGPETEVTVAGHP